MKLVVWDWALYQIGCNLLALPAIAPQSPLKAAQEPQ